VVVLRAVVLVRAVPANAKLRATTDVC
jgi:hypothetical protein